MKNTPKITKNLSKLALIALTAVTMSSCTDREFNIYENAVGITVYNSGKQVSDSISSDSALSKKLADKISLNLDFINGDKTVNTELNIGQKFVNAFFPGTYQTGNSHYNNTADAFLEGMDAFQRVHKHSDPCNKNTTPYTDSGHSSGRSKGHTVTYDFGKKLPAPVIVTPAPVIVTPAPDTIYTVPDTVTYKKPAPPPPVVEEKKKKCSGLGTYDSKLYKNK